MQQVLAKWLWRILICLLVSGLAGCKKEMELHSQLSESDANEVVAALVEHQVLAYKRAAKEGVSVVIDEADIATAVQILNERGLPRQNRTSMGEVFRKEGIISSPLEERARYLYALSQELENTLSQIPGVIVARVHVVLPEKVAPGEPVQPSSAGVFIKHQPVLDPDVALPKIKRMVASSIPGLMDAGKDNISVVFVPVAPSPRQARSEVDAADGASLSIGYYHLAVGALILALLVLFRGSRHLWRRYWIALRQKWNPSALKDIPK